MCLRCPHGYTIGQGGTYTFSGGPPGAGRPTRAGTTSVLTVAREVQEFARQQREAAAAALAAATAADEDSAARADAAARGLAAEADGVAAEAEDLENRANDFAPQRPDAAAAPLQAAVAGDLAAARDEQAAARRADLLRTLRVRDRQRCDRQRWARSEGGYFDCYAVLGVARDAGQDEIWRAHRGLASVFHPDKLGRHDLGEEERQLAADVTQEINAAHDELCDEANRRQLDGAIRRAAASGAADAGAARDASRHRRERQEARRPGPQRAPDPLGDYVRRWWGQRRALVQRNLALGVAVARQDQLGPGFDVDVRAQRDGGRGPLGNPYSMHVHPAHGHRARLDESQRDAVVLANAFRARELARRNLAYLRSSGRDGQTDHVHVAASSLSRPSSTSCSASCRASTCAACTRSYTATWMGRRLSGAGSRRCVTWFGALEARATCVAGSTGRCHSRTLILLRPFCYLTPYSATNSAAELAELVTSSGSRWSEVDHLGMESGQLTFFN